MKTENGIDTTDLDRLTMLSCEMVNQMDFPASAAGSTGQNTELLRKSLSSMLEEMSNRYQESELLFDLRAAILQIPVGKTEIYRITRDLLRMLRTNSDDHAGLPETVALPMIQQVANQSAELRLAS